MEGISLKHKGVDQHLKTNKHKNNKSAIEQKKNRSNNSSQQQQSTLETFENINSERDELNLELVKVFTAADIPLEKINKLRPFFRKYCKNGGTVVGANQLREKYLPKLYDQEVEKLNNSLKNEKICIIVDETTDACGRAAVNVLFAFKDQTKLVATEHIIVVNNTTISQMILSTLQKYQVPFNNVLLFITDNAAYMVKAFKNLSPTQLCPK
ncbi:hypothetical protein RclHR1_22210004 [Rhizophagus clarus]|uniref:Uncharacterized protein n=1 Tax=Rhizophagus clarus TaxID=94130 RepID=A0A2Z6QW10_9GLOM|nr:hypothetical protein RclHR1_22210004 [Rhizophagus clarus]